MSAAKLWRWMPCLLAGALAVALCTQCTQAQQTRQFTITVVAEKMDYFDLPLFVDLDLSPQTKAATLEQINPPRTVPCQLVPAGDKVRLWWILDELKKGQSRTYRLTVGRGSSSGPGVEVRRKDGTVDVTLRGKPFATYCFTDLPKPVLYPLIGPTGVNVTRHYPMRNDVPGESHDHIHHRSLWWTHGEVNGVDFWAESPKAGKTVHRAFELLAGGPVLGIIRARNDWVAPGGKKVLEDVREIRFYNVARGRVFDFAIELRATEGPVEFGDTKEGSFGIRLAPSLRVDKGGHMVNANGDKDKQCWGKRAPWCDDYGVLQGKVVGVAIMDSPQSFRYPTYWHARTYGLFAANPFGLRYFIGDKAGKGRYTLPQGQSIKFLYRVYLHEGDTEAAQVAQRYAQFAQPPKIAVSR